MITLCDKKFVSDLQHVSVFFPTPVSSTNKTDHHDITEILLKVALSTINQPTMCAKESSPFMQSSMKITYMFSHNLYTNLMLWQLVNFLFVVKWFCDYFYKVTVSTNYKKIILKFFVFSTALSRTDTNLPVVREITRINYKIIILEWNWECAKGWLLYSESQF